MKPLLVPLRHLYKRFFAAVDYLQSPFLLAVRFYWGWQLIQSGWGKLHNLPKVTEFFTSLNLPIPAQMAVFISCAEFFGGNLLAVGVPSPVTAFVLNLNIVLAYLHSHLETRQSISSDP